jgi:centromere protein I
MRLCNGDQGSRRPAASTIPATKRTVNLAGVVHVVCRHAFANGLDEDSLFAIVHIVSRKTHLDQSSVTTLVKNLYPAQRLSSDIIVAVVAALGQSKGKPSVGTQDLLVKWLTSVHEITQDANVLSRLYSVLFGLLDMISIRCARLDTCPGLC